MVACAGKLPFSLIEVVRYTIKWHWYHRYVCTRVNLERRFPAANRDIEVTCVPGRHCGDFGRVELLFYNICLGSRDVCRVSLFVTKIADSRVYRVTPSIMLLLPAIATSLLVVSVFGCSRLRCCLLVRGIDAHSLRSVPCQHRRVVFLGAFMLPSQEKCPAYRQLT